MSRYALTILFHANTNEEARRWFSQILSAGLDGWRDQIKPYDSELTVEAAPTWSRVDVLERKAPHV